MEVIAGTASHLVCGYFVKPNEEQKLKFSASFNSDPHCAAVKCIAVCKKGILASGSSDESIQLFKLKGKRTEIGNLRQHTGTVTSLKFHNNSHLFSASEDGTIAIWKVGSWECQKVLLHKVPVYDFAIHPSGKLLLSVCKDRTLQTWNLQNGRRAFIVNLKDAGTNIVFNGDGELFVVNCDTYVTVYLTNKAEVMDTITPPSKVSSIAFYKPRILLIGLENGFVMFYSLKKHANIFELNTKTRRVKSMSVVDSKLAVASSDGYLKLYEVLIEPKKEMAITFITGIVTTQRWLCMCAYSIDEDNKKVEGKEENKDDDKGAVEEDEEEDGDAEEEGDDSEDDEEEGDDGEDDEEEGDDDDDDDEEENGEDDDEKMEE